MEKLFMNNNQGSLLGFGQSIEIDNPRLFDPVYYDGELPIYQKNGTLDLDKCEDYINSEQSIVKLGKKIKYYLIERLQEGYYKKPKFSPILEKVVLEEYDIDVHKEIYPFIILAIGDLATS